MSRSLAQGLIDKVYNKLELAVRRQEAPVAILGEIVTVGNDFSAAAEKPNADLVALAGAYSEGVKACMDQHLAEIQKPAFLKGLIESDTQNFQRSISKNQGTVNQKQAAQQAMNQQQGHQQQQALQQAMNQQTANQQQANQLKFDAYSRYFQGLECGFHRGKLSIRDGAKGIRYFGAKDADANGYVTLPGDGFSLQGEGDRAITINPANLTATFSGGLREKGPTELFGKHWNLIGGENMLVFALVVCIYRAFERRQARENARKDYSIYLSSLGAMGHDLSGMTVDIGIKSTDMPSAKNQKFEFAKIAADYGAKFHPQEFSCFSFSQKNQLEAIAALRGEEDKLLMDLSALNAELKQKGPSPNLNKRFAALCNKGQQLNAAHYGASELNFPQLELKRGDSYGGYARYEKMINKMEVLSKGLGASDAHADFKDVVEKMRNKLNLPNQYPRPALKAVPIANAAHSVPITGNHSHSIPVTTIGGPGSLVDKGPDDGFSSVSADPGANAQASLLPRSVQQKQPLNPQSPPPPSSLTHSIPVASVSRASTLGDVSDADGLKKTPLTGPKK